MRLTLKGGASAGHVLCIGRHRSALAAHHLRTPQQSSSPPAEFGENGETCNDADERSGSLSPVLPVLPSAPESRAMRTAPRRCLATCAMWSLLLEIGFLREDELPYP